MDKKEILKSIDILTGLDEEQYDMLLPHTELVDMKADETAFSAGETASSVYFLLKGRISVQVQLSSRPETLGIIVIQQPGQLVGWSGLVDTAYYTATGLCKEDTQLLSVNGKELMKTLEHNTCTGFVVMREISKVISSRIRNLQSVVIKTI